MAMTDEGVEAPSEVSERVWLCREGASTSLRPGTNAGAFTSSDDLMLGLGGAELNDSEPVSDLI